MIHCFPCWIAVCTSTVPPSPALTRLGTNKIVGWSAWAFVYRPLSNTSPDSTNSEAMTNLASLAAYRSAFTNSAANSQLFFRLKQ